MAKKATQSAEVETNETEVKNGLVSTELTARDFQAPTAALPSFTPVDDFEDEDSGEVIGANYPRLELAEGQVSCKLEYLKLQTIVVPSEDADGNKINEEVKIPCARDIESGTILGLPTGAIFKKHMKEADLSKGDVFAFKRYGDAIKKAGKGKGSAMKVFAIKVYSRAE